MSRVLVHRPVRMRPEPVPDLALAVPAPPRQASRPTSVGGWVTLLVPLLSSITMATYMINYGKPLLIAVGIAYVVLSIATTVAIRWQMSRSRRGEASETQSAYLRHVTAIRQQARSAARAQKLAAEQTYPEPERLLELVTQRRRVWERRPHDADYLHVRVGFGRGRLTNTVRSAPRPDPTAKVDLVAARAADQLVRDTENLPLAPAWLDLCRSGIVSVLGTADRTRGVARALLCQLVALHAPDEVRLMIVAGDTAAAAVREWEWAGWLPHTRSSVGRGEDDNGADAGAPLVGGVLEDLAVPLRAALRRASARPARGWPAAERERHVVVLLDRFDPHAEWARSALFAELMEACQPDGGTPSVHVICLVPQARDEPSRVDARVRVAPHDDGTVRVELEAVDGALVSQVVEARADDVRPAVAEVLARRLAPLLPDDNRRDETGNPQTFLAQLGFGDPAQLDPRRHWVAPDSDDVLRTPIGTDLADASCVLDLKEAALGGMGPHGLVVGATGSGKSELLRTLTTGLTATHSPDLLSLVLVDFKGGATFAGLTALPHVAGLITNLADDLGAVDRARAALVGELQRRQRLLRQAGDVDSVREYQLRYAAGHADRDGRLLEPLPHLLVVVDEFGELLTQRPDFIEVFVQIGRLGRSLGIHLLLASQRLEEGRLRGLESHLSYRIALRTFSAAESHAVLGSDAAHRLPSRPGAALMKFAGGDLVRLQVAHVSRPSTARAPADDPPAVSTLLLSRRSGLPVRRTVAEPRPSAANGAATGADRASGLRAGATVTVMSSLVAASSGIGRPAHQVWLRPLPTAFSLDAVLDGATEAASTTYAGRFVTPVGVLDLPLQQRQEWWGVDFEETAHWAVTGAPRTGKSVFLRTLLASLAISFTPEQAQFLALDLGGGGLAGLSALPHCGGIAGRHEPERLKRMLPDLVQRVARREAIYRAAGLDSPQQARELRSRGRFPDPEEQADLVLAIDNWGAVRTEVADADALLLEIAARGPGVGVHIVLTAARWNDVRPALRDLIDGRTEFRLNDPAESLVNRQQARLARSSAPGRLLVTPGQWVQIALPRLDGRTDDGSAAAAFAALVTRSAADWTGPPARQLRILPRSVDRRDYTDQLEPSRPEVPLGPAEADLRVVWLDLLGRDQHLAVVGEAGSGKTSALRLALQELTRRHPARHLRVLVIDPRRTLAGVVPYAHLAAYAGDRAAAAHYVRELCGVLAERLAGRSAGTPRWSGGQQVVAIDDLDLLEGIDSPLSPLLDYLPHAEEVGLHVVAARRSAGIARQLAGATLVARLTDLAAPFLLLSGDAREGVVAHQQRLMSLPPGRARLAHRGGDAPVIQIFDPSGD